MGAKGEHLRRKSDRQYFVDIFIDDSGEGLP